MEDIQITEEGLVNLSLTNEEFQNLKRLLSRKSGGVKGPRVHREGNKIIIDTGLDEWATFNKGTPQEVHAYRVYQRAEKHQFNENGELIPESVVPALMVVETVEGDYRYMNGEPVNKIEDIDIIPNGESREKVLLWFRKKYEEKKWGKEGESEEVATSEEATPLPAPINEPTQTQDEPELELRDKIILGVVKGIEGKKIAETLGVTPAVITYHKKWAIKEKFLTKDGKKFTPLGLERYGQMKFDFN